MIEVLITQEEAEQASRLIKDICDKADEIDALMVDATRSIAKLIRNGHGLSDIQFITRNKPYKTDRFSEFNKERPYVNKHSIESGCIEKADWEDLHEIMRVIKTHAMWNTNYPASLK